MAALTGTGLRAAFPSRDRVPVESVRVDRETVGTASTALLDDALLSYVDYPQFSRRSIANYNAIVLQQISEAHLRALRLEPVNSSGRGTTSAGIEVTVDGNLIRGAVGTGEMEWTQDCANEDHGDAPNDATARTTGACERHMIRGGSWGSGPRNARSAVRGWNVAGFRGDGLGLRVARTLP